MKELDKKQFVSSMKATAKMYRAEMTDDIIEIYWRVLESITLEEFSAQLSLYLSDPDYGQFMPKPADLLRFKTAKQPSAVIAWAEVLDTMEKIGAYTSVLFEDGAIAAVIRDLGGWPAVCNRQMTDDDPIWLQREFERRYNDYRGSGRIFRDQLEGLHDNDNRNRGYLDGVRLAVFIGSAQELPAIQAVKEPKQLGNGDQSQ